MSAVEVLPGCRFSRHISAVRAPLVMFVSHAETPLTLVGVDATLAGSKEER